MESAPDSTITSAVYSIGTNGSLAAGDSFTLFLKPDGTLYSVGDNGRGQEADNQAEKSVAYSAANFQLEYRHSRCCGGRSCVGGHQRWIGMGMGCRRPIARVGGWWRTSDLLTPTQLTSLSGITSVAAAPFGGFAIDGSGNLYGWGVNDQGQLGDGTNTGESTPEAITSVSNVVKVAASPNFTLVLQTDGTVVGQRK